MSSIYRGVKKRGDVYGFQERGIASNLPRFHLGSQIDIALSSCSKQTPNRNVDHHRISSRELPHTLAHTMAPLPTLQTILISHLSDAAVLFTYNQPQISNAFTIQQYHDLAAALTWANCSPSIRVIVLTGKGKHYCAGKVLSPPGQGPTIEEEIEAGGVLGAVLLQFPKVLIAAVHGAAIGWGCTQLYNFDLVYASPSAVFQTPFMSLGFVPEGGSSWTFPRVMGKLHANRLVGPASHV